MIEIKRNNNGHYFFRVKAENGQILCHSEMYVSKQGCVKGVNSLIGVISKLGSDSLSVSAADLYKKPDKLITDCPCFHSEKPCMYACPCHNPFMSGVCYSCENRNRDVDRAMEMYEARQEALDSQPE